MLKAGGVDGNLVSARLEHPLHIVYRSQATAHRKGYKDLLRRAGGHIQHDAPLLGGSSNVIEHQLVSALPIVKGG